MTDAEIIALFESIALRANDAIDTLMAIRQSSVNGRKQKLSYVTKKLEVIVGACNRGMEKLKD